jgi:bifunctional N-acetylglucosamine-1-phosphate-uridyltransferase/glucosamine-1-phosphate-acetyltransferase GlmU-like protein
LPDGDEILGVNNRRELAEAGRRLNRRTLNRLMDAGVTIVDPATPMWTPLFAWAKTRFLNRTRFWKETRGSAAIAESGP